MPPFVKLFLFSCPIFISLLFIHSIIYLFIVCLLTYKSLCFCEAHNIIWIIILLLPWLIDCFRSDEEFYRSVKVMAVVPCVINELMIHMTASDGSVISTRVSSDGSPMLNVHNTMHTSMFLSNSSLQSDVPVHQLESVMGCTITNLCLSVFLSYVPCVCGLALILLKHLLWR